MRRREPADRRLTLFLPAGAVAGRAQAVYDTGLSAIVDGLIPPHERHAFTLHLPGAVLAGEVVCVRQEARECRLQFVGLTEDDRALLAPWREDEP